MDLLPTSACVARRAALSATIPDRSSGHARVPKPMFPSAGTGTMAMIALLVLTVPAVVSAVCDVCGIRNPHTKKDYSTPFEGPLANYPACKMYKDATCCDAAITTECGSACAVSCNRPCPAFLLLERLAPASRGVGAANPQGCCCMLWRLQRGCPAGWFTLGSCAYRTNDIRWQPCPKRVSKMLHVFSPVVVNFEVREASCQYL